MLPRIVLRLGSFAPLALLSFGLWHCGDDDPSECPEPAYGGDATDEAWRTMVDGDDRAIVGDEHAPALTEPAEAAEVSAAGTSLRIVWASPIARARRVPRGPRRAVPAPAWPAGLGSLLEGTAWAHLPPVTGDIYWLRLTVPGRVCPLEAVTTQLEWVVSGDAWQDVRAAVGQTVTIDLTSAYLNENRITEGPYRPSALRAVSVVP